MHLLQIAIGTTEVVSLKKKVKYRLSYGQTVRREICKCAAKEEEGLLQWVGFCVIITAMQAELRIEWKEVVSESSITVTFVPAWEANGG